MKDTKYIGRTKEDKPENIYLTDFKWACGWYWSGGYLGNRNSHFHFDSTFLQP